LRGCGDWLARLLARHDGLCGEAADDPMLRLALVDGSTVSAPGSAGSDRRLHARYEPGAGSCTDLVLTDASQALWLCCVAIRPGDVVLCDRGYARVRNFTAVRQADSHFIPRIGWRSIKMFDAHGQVFDPLAHLPTAEQVRVEHSVRVGQGANGCRPA
jgi:hypothetical protein